MTAIVNGLEQEYNGDLECDIQDATTEESRARIQGFGFANHGLVVFDRSGNLRAKRDGHMLGEREIRAAVETALQEEKGG